MKDRVDETFDFITVRSTSSSCLTILDVVMPDLIGHLSSINVILNEVKDL